MTRDEMPYIMVDKIEAAGACDQGMQVVKRFAGKDEKFYITPYLIKNIWRLYKSGKSHFILDGFNWLCDQCETIQGNKYLPNPNQYDSAKEYLEAFMNDFEGKEILQFVRVCKGCECNLHDDGYRYSEGHCSSNTDYWCYECFDKHYTPCQNCGSEFRHWDSEDSRQNQLLNVLTLEFSSMIEQWGYGEKTSIPQLHLMSFISDTLYKVDTDYEIRDRCEYCIADFKEYKSGLNVWQIIKTAIFTDVKVMQDLLKYIEPDPSIDLTGDEGLAFQVEFFDPKQSWLNDMKPEHKLQINVNQEFNTLEELLA